MSHYWLRRLLISVPVLLGISIVLFTILACVATRFANWPSIPMSHPRYASICASSLA